MESNLLGGSAGCNTPGTSLTSTIKPDCSNFRTRALSSLCCLDSHVDARSLDSHVDARRATNWHADT